MLVQQARYQLSHPHSHNPPLVFSYKMSTQVFSSFEEDCFLTTEIEFLIHLHLVQLMFCGLFLPKLALFVYFVNVFRVTSVLLWVKIYSLVYFMDCVFDANTFCLTQTFV